MSKRHSTRPFFENSDLHLTQTKNIVKEALVGADYGEFFHQVQQAESLSKNMGQFSNASFGSRSEGFGFRAGKGASVAYAYADQFNKEALLHAIKQSNQVLKSQGSEKTSSALLNKFGKCTEVVYPYDNALLGMSAQDKITALNEIETYVMGLDPNIRNVSIGYSSAMDQRHIITSSGLSLVDYKPMSSLGISVQLANAKGEMQSAIKLFSSRAGCAALFDKAVWRGGAQEALDEARLLHEAGQAPAGKMDVVLSPGWSAVLLHEAVGHGLEGDFNRKGISVYSGKVGQRVAAPGVTIIDQGNMPGERGSIFFDDEGTPSQQNILVEDGILQGYMQDRQNALLMNAELTGNGRRQTYRHAPMPRMTNTYFANGIHDPKDIIASVKDGLYVASMGGGQVDITSGRFNMNVTLGYRIRNGILCEPVKGAAVIGAGHDIIQKIDMIGNDLEIEKHAGACGKNGQSVAVSCGQPTILVSDLTIGGIG